MNLEELTLKEFKELITNHYLISDYQIIKESNHFSIVTKEGLLTGLLFNCGEVPLDEKSLAEAKNIFSLHQVHVGIIFTTKKVNENIFQEANNFSIIIIDQQKIIESIYKV